MSTDGGRHQLPRDHPDYLAALRPPEDSDPSTDEVLVREYGSARGGDPDAGTGYATVGRHSDTCEGRADDWHSCTGEDRNNPDSWADPDIVTEPWARPENVDEADS